MFGPLANKTYAHLFTAQLVALIGTGVTTVALALLAYDLAGSDAGQVLGIALAIKMLAYVGLAPFAGSIAPFMPRRSYLIVLDIARALIVACLPFVTAVWQVYVLVFLMQACSAGFVPVFQATVPDVLEDEDEYTQALSLSRLAYDLENLASPALAAAALIVLSFESLFVVNAVAFFMSAALIWSVSLPRPKFSSRPGQFWEGTLFGIRAYLLTPRLRGLLAASLASAAAGAMVLVNSVVLAHGPLGSGEQGTAILLAAFGAGSMVAALLLPSALHYISEKSVVVTSGLLMALSLGAATWFPSFGWVLAFWGAIGIGYSAVQLLGGRLLRRSSGAGDRPSYFSAHFALSHLCWLVTYPLAGMIGSYYGLTAASAVLAVITVVATVLAVLAWPTADTLEQDHLHSASVGEHMHIHDDHHVHGHEGWEGPEPHDHTHQHAETRHSHPFVIDDHHTRWPHRG